jgi:hypothetical protein
VTLLSHAARSKGVLQKKAVKQLRSITWNTKRLTRDQALAVLCQLGICAGVRRVRVRIRLGVQEIFDKHSGFGHRGLAINQQGNH